MITKAQWKKGFKTTRDNIAAFGLKLPDWYSEEMPADRLGSPDKVVKMLVQKGVNINEKSKGTAGMGPMTPLDLGGQSARVVDAKGKSAIFFAIDNDDLEMVRVIAEGNGFDGNPYSFSAKKMTNCVGGVTYGPAGYAKASNASSAIVQYLESKGL